MSGQFLLSYSPDTMSVHFYKVIGSTTVKVKRAGKSSLSPWLNTIRLEHEVSTVFAVAIESQQYYALFKSGHWLVVLSYLHIVAYKIDDTPTKYMYLYFSLTANLLVYSYVWLLRGCTCTCTCPSIILVLRLWCSCNSRHYPSVTPSFPHRLHTVGCMPPPVSSAVILTKAVGGNEVRSEL